MKLPKLSTSQESAKAIVEVVGDKEKEAISKITGIDDVGNFLTTSLE
jgi:hypothetical protein